MKQKQLENSVNKENVHSKNVDKYNLETYLNLATGMSTILIGIGVYNVSRYVNTNDSWNLDGGLFLGIIGLVGLGKILWDTYKK